MAWLSKFLLGRPGYEIPFDVNPEAMSIEEQPIAVYHRNLVGDLKRSVLKTTFPTININSSYLTKDQKDQFSSMIGISDTFLSFQTRTDWRMYLEKTLLTDSTHMTLQDNSALKLSKILVDNGFTGTVTINGVYSKPSLNTFSINSTHNSIDYYTGGSGYTATIATGVYFMGTSHLDTGSLCAAVKTAIGGLVDSVTFDRDTNKMTIHSSSATFSLLWHSGTNHATSAYSVLGWSDADTSLSASQTSDLTSVSNWAETNYYSSYSDSTRIVTLGSALSGTYGYVDYYYKGWLVNMEKFSNAAHGGWIDRFSYGYQLTGV
jgi:hypothetical protein